MGWDIHNQNNEIETLREVTVEDRLKINKSIRRPDYAFRANRKIQFYVEAKKPAVSLMFEREPANQVREYGWNGRTDVSVVTNFAELSIHDCTKKVTKRDGATTGRLKYLAYTDYLQNFDFLWEILAYENVINGSLEKYAQSKIDYKHAEPVNEAFLKALNDWREYLATNIAQRNKQLEEEDINFAVQMLIDRIVFLRVCEDRNIEPNEQLLQIAKSKGNTYQLLFDLFKIADQKYNSGIFNFKKDALTASLNIDNKVVKKILLEFYNDEDEGIGRFNFAMIPIEILGYAYEQFLGKVIVLEKTGKATIVEKHKDSEETKKGKASETRKAGGVYYTPSYIVDYIVENTVGKAVEGKTPEEVSNIKIIDPSCGSGSF
ncbi:MAG: methyltransferase, partial [Bacteroidetes bacterium]